MLKDKLNGTINGKPGLLHFRSTGGSAAKQSLDDDIKRYEEMMLKSKA
jgi:hypothetical protein